MEEGGEGHLDPQILLALIDSTLRKVICGVTVSPLQPGISIKTHTLRSTLSEVSPVLFSPGYLEVCIANQNIPIKTYMIK